MQEAYRPRHIKYSICYPRWGTPPAGVTPPSQVWFGGGYPRWAPRRVPPIPGLMGGGTWGGVPPAGVPPPSQVWWGRGTRGGVPPKTDRGWILIIIQPRIKIPESISFQNYLDHWLNWWLVELTKHLDLGFARMFQIFVDFYRPHPKMREGNVFSLSTPGARGGGGEGYPGQVQRGGVPQPGQDTWSTP